MTDNIQTERSRRQVLSGTVVSDKMEKTVTIKVERTIMHPLYKRFMKKSQKYVAHDEANECSIGDRVVITSCRPLSKRKRWRVTEIVAKAN